MELSEIYQDLLDAYFIILMSNYGNGKSLVSAYLNLLMAEYNNRNVMLCNTPMYNLSSYDIEFIPLISTSQLADNPVNTQLNLDELQTIANSRDSTSPRNSFVTEFSTDIRKFKNGVCSTCQFGNTIDVRLYDNAEYIIVPEFKVKSKKREKRQNFEMYLNILYKETGYTDFIEVDMKSILNIYNTNFKPYRIIVNHPEYLDRLKSSKSNKFYDEYIYKCEKEITKMEKIFKLEMKGKL